MNKAIINRIKHLKAEKDKTKSKSKKLVLNTEIKWTLNLLLSIPK